MALSFLILKKGLNDMQPRPIRSNIYLPVVRFGVADSDWKFVLLATCLGYAVPFFFNIRVYHVPLEMITGLLLTALAVAFFNFIRIGRRPYWLQHNLKALIKGPTRRAVLPADRERKPVRPWLITLDLEQQPTYR
jgi:hypothetical protein